MLLSRLLNRFKGIASLFLSHVDPNRKAHDYQCRQESRSYGYYQSGNVAAGGDSPNWDLFKACMEAKEGGGAFNEAL